MIIIDLDTLGEINFNLYQLFLGDLGVTSYLLRVRTVLTNITQMCISNSFMCVCLFFFFSSLQTLHTRNLRFNNFPIRVL